MDKYYFLRLLHRYREGNVTKEERQFILDYYNLFEHEQDVKDILSAEERTRLKEAVRAAVWENMQQEKLAESKISLLTKKRVYAVAAAMLLVIVTGAVLLFLKQTEKTGTTLTARQKENRVLLLPDGSMVILTPGSRLNYPSSFDEMEKREVFLSGQAFFEVAQNASKPFVVHTGHVETLVLGTSFNARAMPGEQEIIVTVKTGKVKVSNRGKELGIITPNQQIVFNKEKENMVAQTVKDDTYLAWKENDLLFDNITISEAARLLEKQYQVKISISSQVLGAQRFTATFARHESLEHALESICIFNNAAYSISIADSTVVISER